MQGAMTDTWPPAPRLRPRDAGLIKALAAVGSISELARRIDLTRQAVSNWERIPAELVPRVEKATGVDRTELRPDLWDAEATR